MAKLNLITWNCAGETARGARELVEIINTLTRRGWPADVIVVQGADPVPGGHIHDRLAGLGGAYRSEPAHVTDGYRETGGYLLLTRGTLVGQESLARVDLTADLGLRRWIDTDPAGHDRVEARAALAALDMPVAATLLHGVSQVNLLTWRVPTGPGRVLRSGVLPGGANPDAFLFLQHADLFTELSRPGDNNIGILAGDLAVTGAAVNSGGGTPPLRRLLPGFTGIANLGQHVVGHGQLGWPEATFPTGSAGYYPVPGHASAVLHATVVWADLPRRRRLHSGRRAVRPGMCHR